MNILRLLSYKNAALVLLITTGLASAADTDHLRSQSQVTEGTSIELGDSVVVLKRSHDSGGNLVVISNQTDQRLKVSSSLGMESWLNTDESTSWDCQPDQFAGTLVLEAATGFHIRSSGVACGDAIYLSDGGK